MRKKACFLLVLLSVCFSSYPQKFSGKRYHIKGHRSVYFPLGSISFADSLIDFKVGNPPPIEKYRDSTQCLHEPNYRNYRTPNFVSLGCGGVLTVQFTDNGFMNLPGDDLYIFEVGPSRESAKIEISEDGKTWIYAGKISGGKSAVDLEDQGIDTQTVFYFLRITDLEDLCNSISAGADIDAIGAISSVVKIDLEADVLFDVDSYRLRKEAKAQLDSIAGTIRKFEKATIQIAGHTDSDGGETMNMILSENRCKSVKNQLEKLLDSEAVYDYDMKAFGKNSPRVPNTSPENKQLNRRVEILILPPKDFY